MNAFCFGIESQRVIFFLGRLSANKKPQAQDEKKLQKLLETRKFLRSNVPKVPLVPRVARVAAAQISEAHMLLPLTAQSRYVGRQARFFL